MSIETGQIHDDFKNFRQDFVKMLDSLKKAIDDTNEILYEIVSAIKGER